jgi:hypothetical protein
VRVPSIDKPRGQLCDHWQEDCRCSIHAEKPDECRRFRCLWLANENIADRYRPDQIGLYVTSTKRADTLCVRVDPRRPNAWQEGLGHAVIENLRRSFRLIIVVGDKSWSVTDDR